MGLIIQAGPQLAALLWDKEKKRRQGDLTALGEKENWDMDILLFAEQLRKLEGPFVSATHDAKMQCAACKRETDRTWICQRDWPPLHDLCLNCALRSHAHSSATPDCRAFEMVGKCLRAKSPEAKLVTYEIYELVDIEVGNGTKQAKRVIE